MTTKPRRHLAFTMPPELARRAEAIVGKIRADSTPGAHADELIEIIVELTHAGLSEYFLAPLVRVEVGPLAMGTARMSVAAAGKSLPALVRSVIGKMTDDQLREVAEILDEMMV